MATPYPDIDWNYEPNTQDLYLFEQRVFPDGGGVVFCEGLANLYRMHFRRSRIRRIMRDVLGGGWGFRTTLEGLADDLSTDHGTLSKAKNDGELSSPLEHFLWGCPGRPDDYEQRLTGFIPWQHREAFIALAKHLMQLDRPDCPLLPLREVDAECIFQILENRALWDRHKDDAAHPMMSDIVACAIEEDVLPFWYAKRERSEVAALISVLTSDARVRFEYLTSLFRDWRQAVIAAEAAAETIRWPE